MSLGAGSHKGQAALGTPDHVRLLAAVAGAAPGTTAAAGEWAACPLPGWLFLWLGDLHLPCDGPYDDCRQLVGEWPVVTVWYILGTLRIRRYMPVFTFWNV